MLLVAAAHLERPLHLRSIANGVVNAANLSTACVGPRRRPFSQFQRAATSRFSNAPRNSSIIKMLPNIITSMRIIACPFLTYAIAVDMKGVALGGCVLAGVTDWMDGYIARKYDAATPLGAFLDPLADKIFIGSVTIGLAMTNVLPPLLAFVIVGRDVLLISGSFYLRAKEKKDSSDFFDINSTTFNVMPSTLSKINTLSQFLVLIGSLAHFVIGYPSFGLLEPFWYLTAVTTISSGLGYLSGSGLNRRNLLEKNNTRNNSEK